VRKALLILAVSGVAGCSTITSSANRVGERLGINQGPRVTPFRARLTAGKDKRDFSVTVVAKGAGLADVRESVRYPATRYCMIKFGGSDAAWTLDPATGDWAASAQGDRMVFHGRCLD